MSKDAASPEGLSEWIGHLALEGEVADSLYTRFSGVRRGTVIEARQGSDLVGVCVWRQDEGFAFLGPVAVHPEKRSWGLGSTLVGRAIEDIRSEGARSIESVYPSGDRASTRLFKQHRFRILGDEHVGTGPTWTRIERHLKKS
jgi:GNAT superfamily N-acetyltransferase